MPTIPQDLLDLLDQAEADREAALAGDATAKTSADAATAATAKAASDAAAASDLHAAAHASGTKADDAVRSYFGLG